MTFGRVVTVGKAVVSGRAAVVGKVEGVGKLAVGKTVLVWLQGLSRACKVQKRLDLEGGARDLKCRCSLTLTHCDVNITLYICAEGSDIQIRFSVMGYATVATSARTHDLI